MSVHLRWRCRSGAAYNAGMEDAETLAIIPSGPGRALVDEPSGPPATSHPAALPPESPESLSPESLSPAGAPAPRPSPLSPPSPLELPLSELEFTGCKAVRMT